MVMAHTAVPFDEVGPLHVWTIDDLAGLPAGEQQYEIVDGQLMMVPPPLVGHQLVVKRVERLLTSAFGQDYLVLEGVGLDMAPTFRVPDVMAFTADAYSAQATSILPSDVALVVEVVSAGSRTNDRITKPAEYAAAGIVAYWRVETEPALSLTAYVLRPGDSTYTELGTWSAGEVAVIAEPVEVHVDISTLNRSASS